MKRFPLFFLLILACFSPVIAREKVEIFFNPVPNAPYLIGQPELNIDAEEFTTVTLRLKAAKSGTARLFWATNFDPQMNQPKSLWFYLKKSASGRDYVFHLPSQSPYWQGWVGQLLLYPEDPENLVEVLSARAEPTRPLSFIHSGWQEFWGPKGRAVIGSTVNLIPSASVFGHSINLYVYWLALLFFLAATTLSALQQKKINWGSSFFSAGRYTLYFVFGCWFILGLNSYFNYVLITRDNFNKYYGKSLEEKRAVAYGQDLYRFLTFAKEALPQQPTNFAFIGSQAMSDLQARIILIPHRLVELKDAPAYLLLFQSPNTTLPAGYVRYKAFDKNSSILRKEQK